MGWNHIITGHSLVCWTNRTYRTNRGNVPPKGRWVHLQFNLKLPWGSHAVLLAPLCLCYHRIRPIPSFYSGTVASNLQKNENSPLMLTWKLRFGVTGLHSNCQHPFLRPFAKQPWEADRKGSLLSLPSPQMTRPASYLEWLGFTLQGLCVKNHTTISMDLEKLIILSNICWVYTLLGTVAKHYAYIIIWCNSNEIGTIYNMPRSHIWGLN